MKKILIFFTIFSLIFSSLPVEIFAQFQASSGSSDVEFSDSPLASDSGEIDLPDINVYENLNVDPTGLMELTQDENSQVSAFFNLPVKVQQLRKRNFRADEKITIVVENTSTDDVKVQLFDSNGVEVSVEMESVSVQDPAVLRIVPPKQFKAGRYRLSITDSTGKVTNQDFTWGVLAINTNKSIYLPNETANIAIAVLDETGMMVCDAEVELKITNAELGINDTLSTSNGKIIVNPDCIVKDYTPKPDYEATYQVKGIGIYDLALTSHTKNGTYSINDAFDVRDNASFDVERINATRIFPPVTYSSVFNITANVDFVGTITETVPDSFAVLPASQGRFPDHISSESSKLLTEDLIKGEIPQLSLPYQGEFAISQKFGSEIRDPLVAKKYKDFGLAGHDGIDFDLPEGSAVLAADDGEVVLAKLDGDYGTTIVLQHSWGKSYYGHLSEITVVTGQKILKGHPIGLSGSTGLSSGPHLHFGIKPNKNDTNNGYYGKINPAPYLGLESITADTNLISTSIDLQSYGVKVLTWNIDIKKGEKIQLAYGYKVPNISPQFYLLGPLQFTNTNDEVVFQESRQWQLAIDADGSGTNVVSPDTGTTSTTGNTYGFTFDPSELMDSGSIKITVPAGWSAPQGTNGVAGYTTATGNSNATVGTVLNEADSATGWAEDDTDMCNTFGLDTTNFKDSTGSWYCAPTASDAGDSIGFDISSSNWSAYTDVAFWTRSDQTTTDGGFTFFYDNTSSGASPIQEINVPAMSANTWTYVKAALSGTRGAVVTYGLQCNTGTNSDCGLGGTGVGRLNLDYILLGPGVPTFSGSGPWDITVVMLDMAATDTLTVSYGSGGGSSGVTNSSSATAHTFTTQSRISASGTLTNIATSPTITLSAPSGPTNDQLLRHGAWFNSGVEQPFTF